ncbi:MAG: hypothetical protein IJS90_07750 [Clostridia bacterium]|nr:hypothetical protein [Clostridia bacterium]
MTEKNNRQAEVFFTDLAAICAQPETLTSERRLGFWQTVGYETRLGKGTMLAAQNKSQPAPVWLCPELSGWHKIYVGVVALVGGWQNNSVHLRLTDDAASTQFKPASDMVGGGIEEVFWKCADLTVRRIELKKYSGELVRGDCILGWLRFEPMSEEDIAAFQKDAADTTTKNIYAANDMHCLAYLFSAETQRDWNMAAQPYEQSDVEWLSVENVGTDLGASAVPQEAFSYPRDGDENVFHSFSSSYTDEMLQNLVRRGHDMGLKMCVSQRLGAWCNSFPFDEGYFENAFYQAHPEYRCVDRDGEVTEAMSYCYPQVRAYVTDQLLRRAADGFDAVELMFHRGVPYVLFEQPFLELFAAEYGDDPRELPWDNPRITKIRCEIITQFVRNLLRRAGHREEILETLPDENGCSKRCRFLRLGDKFIGRVRPSWGS